MKGHVLRTIFCCVILALEMTFAAGLRAQSKPAEDLSDYSRYATATQFTEAYPRQKEQDGFPEFSWDRIPRWIAFRSDKRISDEAVSRVANHYQVIMLEKSNEQGTSCCEDGVLDVAKRLKSANPKVKTLFYWNTRLRWRSYRANEVFDANPKWTKLVDAKKRSHYNHNIPAMREWWLDVALEMTAHPAIDGLLLDTLKPLSGPAFRDGVPVNRYIGSLATLRQKLPPTKLVIGNGIGNSATNGNREFMRIMDGSYLENWDGLNRQCKDEQSRGESISASIQMMREALAKGKVIMLQTNPSYSNYFTKEEVPPRRKLKECLAFVERNVHFPLACFLMAAEKHAYFSYNHGVYAGTGDNGADIYDTSDLDIFHRPLGPPLGACVRDGFQFRRSFKYLDVAVNVETGETSFQWAKPSVDTRALAAQQAAAKNDVVGATTTSDSADESRVWKTADGKFSVEAEFVGFENDIVQLRRTDNNKTVSVPIEKLSRRDQKHIRNHSKK